MPSESRSWPREIQNYVSRISGPLLNRIDLNIEVPPVEFREITSERTGEPAGRQLEEYCCRDTEGMIWIIRALGGGTTLKKETC